VPLRPCCVFARLILVGIRPSDGGLPRAASHFRIFLEVFRGLGRAIVVLLNRRWVRCSRCLVLASIGERKVRTGEDNRNCASCYSDTFLTIHNLNLQLLGGLAFRTQRRDLLRRLDRRHRAESCPTATRPSLHSYALLQVVSHSVVGEALIGETSVKADESYGVH
jgi:hypothetical protein